jgi:hypothetical protein
MGIARLDIPTLTRVESLGIGGTTTEQEFNLLPWVGSPQAFGGFLYASRNVGGVREHVDLSEFQIEYRYEDATGNPTATVGWVNITAPDTDDYHLYFLVV